MRYTKDTKRFSVDLSENWTELFQPHKYAWVEFNLIKVYAEVDYHTSNAEIDLRLLGFGIRVYWIINKAKYRAWTKKMIKEFHIEDWRE